MLLCIVQEGGIIDLDNSDIGDEWVSWPPAAMATFLYKPPTFYPHEIEFFSSYTDIILV